MTEYFNQQPYWQVATGLPKQVLAGQTLAIVTSAQDIPQPYLQQNFALHVGDDAQAVQHRRSQLLQQLQPFGVKRLQWLNQTHSTVAYVIDDMLSLTLQDGDGLVTQQQGVALMMMTADCLPIVVSNAEGSEVACLHAGWRGLANGIIEATIAKMQTQPSVAWMGAAISQMHFEVGSEVREIFLSQDAVFEKYFIAKGNGKYLADLYAIARHKLMASGIGLVSGGDRCSYAESDQFYSYRRQPITGRMTTFVFITTKDVKLD